MITLVSGINGSGKSLYAAWILAQNWTGPIYTNMRLLPGHPAFHRIGQCGTPAFPVKQFRQWSMPAARYVIDEASLYWPCRSFKTNDGSFFDALAQHRKRGEDWVLVTQRPAQIDVAIRRLVGEYIYCWRDQMTWERDWGVFASLIPTWLGRYRRVHSVDAEAKTVIRAGEFTPAEAERLFSWYDTLAVIGQDVST